MAGVQLCEVHLMLSDALVPQARADQSKVLEIAQAQAPLI